MGILKTKYVCTACISAYLGHILRASFFMFLALLANLRVDSDSLNDSRAGEHMAIMVVLQLPPRLSSRIRVSLLSRYGICCLPEVKKIHICDVF